MRLIDADALYEKVQHDEELARNRVLDTESTLPYPNNLNPSYTRYVAQMDERTRLKFMIADAPTIEPERKNGKWINHRSDEGHNIADCDQCGETMQWYDPDPKPNFCPNCGSYNREEGGE